MLNLSADPAAIVTGQIHNAYGEYGEAWDKNSKECLKNLTILSQLPVDGPGCAIVLATECACEAFDAYGTPKCNKDLQILDHFTLAIVCDEVGHGRKLEVDCDELRSYENVILGMGAWMWAYDLVNDLMEYMQGSRRSDRFSDAQQQELEHLLHENDAKTVTKRVWFPLTMRYLYAYRQEEIADFLIPRIAGQILPVELQDAIAAFCYDEQFFLEASGIARENAAGTHLVGEMEDTENVSG
ncbi:uncharacterized protein RHO25_009831 [Cercospora beticola]|uniref:Uncharacterized protein n=1 Tax=Cercospora beticola TaxID=122368 RepID=A0ABZ0P0D1_CERBT|nr:hypothetical protein RHO25_009831 [Cercospora beticola]CAK1364968.1 unnamed protein product [Cercospora beticola]